MSLVLLIILSSFALFAQDGEEIEVSKGDRKKVDWDEVACVFSKSEPHKIFTEGLTPCIAMVIIAKKADGTSAACMMHVPLPPGKDDNEIKQRAFQDHQRFLGEAKQLLTENGFSLNNLKAIMSAEKDWRGQTNLSAGQKNGQLLSESFSRFNIPIEGKYFHEVSNQVGSRNIEVDLKTNTFTIAEDADKEQKGSVLKTGQLPW